jgi:hypothetical protein
MRYSDVCPPPKLAVRRATAEAMIENAKILDEWIASGELQPANPGEAVPVYLVTEIQALIGQWTAKKRANHHSSR